MGERGSLFRQKSLRFVGSNCSGGEGQLIQAEVSKVCREQL